MDDRHIIEDFDAEGCRVRREMRAQMQAAQSPAPAAPAPLRMLGWDDLCNAPDPAYVTDRDVFIQRAFAAANNLGEPT
jgi:hypothetical protein